MTRIFFTHIFVLLCLSSFSQKKSLEIFLSDSSMLHASVSICIADADSGVIFEHNSGKSLIPASVMKLITSAVALEILGPEYTFKTVIGYTGSINKRTGKLVGDIVIQGRGDPALGSKNFPWYYDDFLNKWVTEIKKLGIRKIDGRVIADDSYYDFMPIPSKWLWEDAGNYYGAGVFGISVFDNTYEIHFKTSSENSLPEITQILPTECSYELKNWLTVSGTTDKGYVFASPYSTSGWLAGTVPVNRHDFVLKAAITDPPLMLAKTLTNKLKTEGVSLSGTPSTIRSEQKNISDVIITIDETISPPLREIIEVLNHESINLYAENLVKELGKKYRNCGSTASGIEVIKEFLLKAGIKTDGMFIEDGSGLSPLDAISSKDLVSLLVNMKQKGKYFPEYYSSLPYAGKEGTLKTVFTDTVFDSRLKAKSGSMTRVRNYAGYFKTISGKDMVFSIIVNNYTGPSKKVIYGIENIIKETIEKN